MLAEKYKSEFLKKDKKNRDLEAIMDRIINKEQEFDTSCINWNNEQLENFLADLHSISPNTISRSLTFLRAYSEFICHEENLKCPEYKLEFGRLYNLVDMKELIENKTITFEQYKHIKNSLGNKRDKCMLGLAWNLLGNDEIRKIKESDVRFEKNQYDMEIAWIKLSDTREIKIEDPELVADLKSLPYEREYVLEASDGRIKKMKYKDTDYLIKPLNVGPKGKEDFIANPSLSLQKAMEQQRITCPGIKDVTTLSLEDIKRSKLIYLLAPQNEKYFPNNDIIKYMLDSGNVDSNLIWLRKVARIKYPDKNNDQQ